MPETFTTIDNSPAPAGPEGSTHDHELSANIQENLSRLQESGEVGASLVPVYLAALELSPELSDVVLNPYNSANMQIPGTTGRATPPHFSDSGHPEVAVNVTSWDEYADVMKARPGAVAEITKKLGIDLSQITPQLFAAFTLSHELGHVEDWRAKGFDGVAIDATYEEELNTLPVPGVPAATITAWAARHPGKAERHIEDNRERLAKLGISTVSELVAAQDLGYRSIPSEDVPDQFAVAVLAFMSAK